MATRYRWFLLIYLGLCAAWMDERPVLESRDGHLYISSAKDRNITLKVFGDGHVNVNEINLLHVASAAQNATRLIQRWRVGYLAEVETNLQRLSDIVEGPTGLQKRIALLEGVGDTNGTFRPAHSSSNQAPGSTDVVRIGLRRVNERVRRLEEKVRTIVTKLKENDCQSNPCQNGGSCQDLYEGYQCHCTTNWEGPNCMADVNECVRFLGTDLGCQNGATCVNLPGSFRCDCAPGWFGLHCTRKTAICNTQNSDELCGHGVCVSKPSSPLGYTCICEQGWEADGTNPACIKDVDECAGKHPACSVNPLVACRNAPGTFFCDSCPHGYTGNGYYCTDIDECLVDNGGCSTSPRVQCINTMGSRMCGACPPGYRGDGVTCIYVGGCAINNGGCHPLAMCVENPALTSAYVQCRCPAGYEGDGMGLTGCRPSTDLNLNSACASNPCVHGTCVPGTMHTFTCRCNPGYTGVTCNAQVDPCSPNPCKNNGACLVSNGGVTCDCPPTFTGVRCETPRQTCGGVSRNPVGHLEFPISGSTYQHGLSCAWVLITNQSLVLNVTFTRFHVEHSADCKFDFLQIHDGRNAGSHMIGRFCGNTLVNQNIVSSHNALYFWFHSDSSISHDGFAFHWNTIEPVCGGFLEADYGTITSPGSPGRYPPNRDCYWRIFVRSSKRIQFHFGQLMLEEHPTCENDYVEITGLEDERLGLYCNHTRPAPLITPGSMATLYFHSDGAGQDAGFHIHYSAIEGVPGCSGVHTSFSGIITSPSHTGSYEPNMECDWKIQLPPGERIKITWLKFELETSTSCQYDYVEIFDGGDTDAPLIGRYCGSQIPPTIKSNSNLLLVVFKSDWSFELEGFTLSYETLCGGEFYEDTGVLHSPMYPKGYQGSRTCTYEIVQPPGKGIVLTIQDMDIEGRTPPFCYFDYLEIFDGDNDNATQLATLCGGEEFIPSDPFYSTHNFMFLKFTTDGTVQGRGFKANYTTIQRRCGGLFKTATGMIQSPTENGYYGDEEECIWTIQAPQGYVVQLTWLTFNLEYQPRCRSDYVSVYENYTSSEKDILGTFCGTRKPPILMTQGRTMTIVFRTDSSVTAEGFVATYLFIDASKVCGGHYTKLNGVIRSPNYPENYPNRKECVWILEAPNRQKITLTVEHFKLENHSACGYDYLEIRNGGYDAAPLIGKFCGTNIPTEITSQTNQMYLKFVSDRSRTSEGFNIEWDSTTEGCGGTLSAANGDIISPNYPQPYAQNAVCYWKIAVAAGNLIQLVIVDLDLEHHDRCRFDYIEISEGVNRRRNSQRYCGNQYSKIIQTKSNMLTIRFRSDFTNSGRGFHLKYETLCHNKVRGFYGVIESPNFPNKYEHNLNCSWIIDAPIGNKINISFSHFDLESGPRQNCQFDYLEIKEGVNDKPNTELAKLCESQVPEKIHSTQHQVFVTFVTDVFIAFNGFRLEWMIDGCGGHLTRPSDDFTSPGYPSAYPTNIECEWLIEVDYTHSVELTIHDINTETDTGCTFDKLQIYGGEDEEAQKLVEICYSDKPVVYTSPGNKMFLKFYSDISHTRRGFSASYKSVALACGGKFTADSGIIHSTNYPQNYPHKQNCEWLLQVDRNHAVNITFLDFDIENSKNCTDDYVQIFDGPTRDSPLMATHCRNELPPSYVSTGNEMLVVMRTDSIITAKGFKAQYSRACGARITVKESGFLTPALSHTSMIGQNKSNCVWILSAEDPADHITLTFAHMEIDMSEFGPFWINTCSSQFIEVHEGEGLEGPSLGKWCGNVAPPPVTSTGSALTVHLFTMFDFWGYFSIAYSVLNSACGGNYTSQQGTIATPGYPNTYPLNSECIWILNNSPGNRVSLTFSEFDLQQSENCDLDYLEIRENSGIGKLITVACGTNIDSITSSSSLWIKFKSDSEGVAKGFVGEYNFLGGNELEGPTGRITSPFFPLPVRRSRTYTWRVTVEFGWAVRIEFKSMFFVNVEHICISSLKIYDGYDTDAPLLVEVCGLDIPDPVVSSSNVVYISMETYFYREGSWFDLTWLQIPIDANEGNQVEVKLSDCNEEVALMSELNNTYSFNSPGWPDGYAPDLQCNWVFTSPPGTHLVLRILAMNLEETSDCVADALSVYSGYALTSTNDAVLEQRLCLSNATYSLVKATNVMTVKFETDGYVNKTGFSAFVYRDCGGKMEGPNGVIEINNASTTRGVRSWHFTCEWNVEVKAGRTIEVKITEMSILQSPTHTCGDSYLMLKNGGDETSPLLGAGKYCGDVAPAPLQTIGNKLYVKVVGTASVVRFKLTYRQVNMDCGGTFVLSSKQKEWEISTPNYPNIPPPYAECTWKAIAPADERVSIHFIERFDLSYSANCEREYVEVRDGGTDSSKSMGRFCKDTAPSSMTTMGNMMYVHFYTDVSEPKNGFKAVITSGELCGGIVRGTSGVINSPNYPFFYPTNQECGWMIVAPTDHTLKIEFRDFHLPGFRRCESTDHVKIREKIPENDTLSDIGTFCGLTKPDLIETSSNEAFVMFHTDNRDYTIYRGFSLNFTSSQEICGGELTAMSGIIKSNGYPNPSTRSRYCDWKIKLPRGFQVVVDILDLDIVGSSGPLRAGYSLSFYNDFRFKSRIKVLGDGAHTQQIKSSSNTMMIGYWSSPGYRGFKLRYSGEAPAPCGGVLSDLRGTITGPTTPPFNESSYFCQWTVKPPEYLRDNETGLTLAVKFTGYMGGTEGYVSYPQRCYSQYLAITDVAVLCGNYTQPKYLRSPKPVNEITIVNGTYGRQMRYNLVYEWQRCGGILQGPSHVIRAPKNMSYPINCAWYADYPDTGEMIKMYFSRLNLGSCENGYITVRNGGATSPEIGKFCGNIKPYNITSTSNHLWIEYFATGAPNDFEFTLELASSGCGGALRGGSREISSPEFPKQYPNNAECTWEITAENGYHVGLAFADRFSLETSANCEKDYVQVFDWDRDKKVGGRWRDLGKVCGRNTPLPFNSTTNRMKVTFRSNEAIQGDGFRALWSENCGGVFTVTTDIKIIQSPAYPNYYKPNLFCNYTLVAPGEDIIVEFKEFQLERGRGDCRFDNITVITHNMYTNEEEEESWCGENKPPLLRSPDRMQIIFKTDKYVHRSGFQFRYFINKCGGTLTAPGEIKPLMQDASYFGRMNCTWIINAPEDKSVVVRFETFVVEYSPSCYFDYVTVYDGQFVDVDKQLGLVCGNLTEHLPIFKSSSNSMVVSFNTDDSRHYEGFTAKVLFTKSVAAGCGGTVNLTSIHSQSFRTQKAATYESLEDCHWTVVTSADRNIRFTINTMDVKNPPKNNTGSSSSKECMADFLEIRDGAGPYSELLGRYCGNTVPPSILSTTNSLWIRFYSDGTVEGAGVTGTFEAVATQCGLSVREVNDTKHVLMSPNYPNPYEPGTRCRWILRHPDEFIDRLIIRFLDFDLTDSGRCENEYLEITDKESRKYINEGFGQNFIFSGLKTHPVTLDMGSRLPLSSYKYCGSALPHDYYSYSNEIEITFKSESGGHRGFKLEYGTATCDRNYTAEQGRILHQGFTDCWITITAPVNHTISLYFNQFRLYDGEQCTETALQIREGDFNGNLLATLCGVETPSPVFSTGNKLSLHSWSGRGAAYENYDITFTTTDAGRGCGGRLFNYGGRFTSPFYPNAYRKNTVCTWDVSVPRGFIITLHFVVFDIGTKKNCGSNYVKLYEVQPNTEPLLITTYCGGDEPALLDASTDRILVEYTSTVNNVGTGWVAVFMGQPTSHPLKVIEGWGY